jgi:hypothetical protein
MEIGANTNVRPLQFTPPESAVTIKIHVIHRLEVRREGRRRRSKVRGFFSRLKNVLHVLTVLSGFVSVVFFVRGVFAVRTSVKHTWSVSTASPTRPCTHGGFRKPGNNSGIFTSPPCSRLRASTSNCSLRWHRSQVIPRRGPKVALGTANNPLGCSHAPAGRPSRLGLGARQC